MASVYARGKIRWVKFYPLGCSQPSRQSLGEVDPALAELIRRKLELELKLRAPELRSVALPANVTETFGDPLPATRVPQPSPVPAEAPPVATAAEPVSPPSPPARKVLAEYLAHIEVENSEHHVKNKTGYLPNAVMRWTPTRWWVAHDISPHADVKKCQICLGSGGDGPECSVAFSKSTGNQDTKRLQ